MQILLVEDDTTLLSNYAAALSDVSEVIHQKTYIQAAWDTLASNDEIMVVVTDWRLPDGTGTELIEKFRVQYKSRSWVEFIILTGQASVELATRAIDLSVRQFLIKPITDPDLRKAVLAASKSAIANRRRAELKKALTQTVRELQKASFDADAAEMTTLLAGSASVPDPQSCVENLRNELVRQRHLSAMFARMNIDIYEWIILLQVALAKVELASITAKSVGHSLNMPLSSLLRRAGRLEEAGLIVRKDDPTDARRVQLESTEMAQREIWAYFQAYAHETRAMRG
jgi:DNA-binding NarL/FixJ family response regulator/DNA-binding MarR family transcriptional regulator